MDDNKPGQGGNQATPTRRRRRQQVRNRQSTSRSGAGAGVGVGQAGLQGGLSTLTVEQAYKLGMRHAGEISGVAPITWR